MEVKTKRLHLVSNTIEQMEQIREEEQNPEMKQAYLEMITEMKRTPGKEYWACEWNMLLDDGTKVGGIGFKGVPDAKGCVEVGYGVDEAFQHQGYATEAVQGMTVWALQQEGVIWVTAQTDPENAISQKVLLKNGYVRHGDGNEGPLFRIKR